MGHRGHSHLQQKSASVDRESAKYLSKLVNKFGRAINKSQGAGVENERKSVAKYDYTDALNEEKMEKSACFIGIKRKPSNLWRVKGSQCPKVCHLLTASCIVYTKKGLLST